MVYWHHTFILMTKKIYVGKNDEVTEVVERMIDADAHEVVLAIPKFSKVGEAAANFHLLRREAEVLKKAILVESVDEVVLKICDAQKIPCVNPFFAAAGRRMADIVSKEASAGTPKRGVAREKERKEYEVSAVEFPPAMLVVAGRSEEAETPRAAQARAAQSEAQRETAGAQRGERGMRAARPPRPAPQCRGGRAGTRPRARAQSPGACAPMPPAGGREP